MSQKIKNQVTDLLNQSGVNYSAVYRGERRGAFGGDQITDSWDVNFDKTGVGAQSFDFYTGLGLRSPAPKNAYGPAPRRGTLAWAKLENQRKPIAPHAADVLYSLVLDSSACDQSFDHWCDEFGYDTDSRKALETYLACQENSNKLHKVFSGAQLEKLRELLQDY